MATEIQREQRAEDGSLILVSHHTRTSPPLSSPRCHAPSPSRDVTFVPPEAGTVCTSSTKIILVIALVAPSPRVVCFLTCDHLLSAACLPNFLILFLYVAPFPCTYPYSYAAGRSAGILLYSGTASPRTSKLHFKTLRTACSLTRGFSARVLVGKLTCVPCGCISWPRDGSDRRRVSISVPSPLSPFPILVNTFLDTIRHALRTVA